MVYTCPVTTAATAADVAASVAPAIRTGKPIDFDASPVRHLMILTAKQNLRFAAILDSGAIAVWNHRGAISFLHVIYSHRNMVCNTVFKGSLCSIDDDCALLQGLCV